MGTFQEFKEAKEEAKQEEPEQKMIPQPAKSDPKKLIDPNYGNSNMFHAVDHDSGKASGS